MNYKMQYVDNTDRQRILDDTTDKKLIEEQNLTDGNFLVFTDDVISQPSLSELKDNQLILMDVLATMYEDMLLKGTV